MTRPTLIGLDADDTLWHNETLFRLTHQRFNELLAAYADAPQVEEHLAAVERRNLKVYGYGAKGFTLSMLETAVELSGGNAPAGVLGEILAAGRELMTHPIDPLPGVRDALEQLAQRAPLLLITKGDLFHQESKLAASGLGDLFAGVEIVSEKTADTYRRAFRRHGTPPEEALMAGNSVRSDILPALEAGAHAALIPYPLVWAHEAAEAPHAHPRFRQFDTLAQLVPWLDSLV
ncbi:HAD family hydrolase [Aquincola sp. S2]|uniref:HAD family hydrolase n=1 Tax=Pseudaquabacterium terrae TaxID=2732868 RepID=A0ABX2ENP2_9BURK|nr:HAD family hydrolase [Aquabacterium terrae]NRF70104.1 HAD family hydrolase [Aquabacterium terrae]